MGPHGRAHRVLVHLDYELLDGVQRRVGPRRGILPVAIQVKAHQRTPAQKQCQCEIMKKHTMDRSYKLSFTIDMSVVLAGKSV